jgi:hypothetical protein
MLFALQFCAHTSKSRGQVYVQSTKLVFVAVLKSNLSVHEGILLEIRVANWLLEFTNFPNWLALFVIPKWASIT